MKLLLKHSVFTIALYVLYGCAAGHLNSNTVEIASQVDNVYTRETLNNLSKFIDDPHAVPSQIILSQGVFQTTDTLTPSLTIPLSSQVANTVTRTATSLTNADANTLAGFSAGVQGSVSQQQNYTGAPLNDANTLRNQRALYMHAVFGVPLKGNYHAPKTIFYKGNFIYDPFYLQEPHCVLCMKEGAYDPEHPPQLQDLSINRQLAKGAWLAWDSAGAGGTDMKLLGRYGDHDLYMTKEDYDNGVLDDFVLFTLSFANPTVVIAAPTPAPSPPKTPAAGRENEEKIAPQIYVAPSAPPVTNQMNQPADRQQVYPSGIIPGY